MGRNISAFVEYAHNPYLGTLHLEKDRVRKIRKRELPEISGLNYTSCSAEVWALKD